MTTGLLLASQLQAQTQASTVPKVLSPMTTPSSSLSNCIYHCGCQHLPRPRSASMALCAELCNHCSTDSMRRPCGAGLGEGVRALWQQCPHVHTESRCQSPCRLETQESRISTFYLQGLGPQRSQWQCLPFCIPKGSPVCGDSDKAVIAPQCRLDAFYTAIAGSTETWSRESIQPGKPSTRGRNRPMAGTSQLRIHPTSPRFQKPFGQKQRPRRPLLGCQRGPQGHPATGP